MKEILCDYRDQECRERLRTVLGRKPFVILEHYEEVGIEKWTYQLGSESLRISEEYGEMYVDGSEALKKWLLLEVRNGCCEN